MPTLTKSLTNPSQTAFVAGQQIGRAHASADVDWRGLPNEELLKWRICDLRLDLDHSPVAACRDRLYSELAQKSLRLKPHMWFSNDWYAPDDIPGIAVPFYMGHPRLMRLERKMMLEVEGGTRAWCMKILRHEAGHTIDSAFKLYRRKGYRELFGNYFDTYPDYYQARPQSKAYVQHLEPWYAQSHPAEDFAETFAVWLTPGSRWKSQYRGWKAYEKLLYVDQLMREIAHRKPLNQSRRRVDPASRMTKTLEQHYAEKHRPYDLDVPSVFDRDLKKLFAHLPETRKCKSAASFLTKNRSIFSQAIAQETGEYRYNINQVLKEMIDRCKVMNLYVTKDERELKESFLKIFPVKTVQYLKRKHLVAL
ncbi:MAG: putative zinc-binding metallopeptidase [Planctomycetota bacterium]